MQVFTLPSLLIKFQHHAQVQVHRPYLILNILLRSEKINNLNLLYTVQILLCRSTTPQAL